MRTSSTAKICRIRSGPLVRGRGGGHSRRCPSSQSWRRLRGLSDRASRQGSFGLTAAARQESRLRWLAMEFQEMCNARCAACTYGKENSQAQLEDFASLVVIAWKPFRSVMEMMKRGREAEVFCCSASALMGVTRGDLGAQPQPPALLASCYRGRSRLVSECDSK
jgi:hypothetical protein